MIVVRTKRHSPDVRGEKVGEQDGSRFETQDLALASFLHCRNFPFVGVEPASDSLSTICVFEDSPELRQAVVDYANDGIVPVRTFFATLKDLQTITR